MFFDFSGAFNTIQPLLLREKLERMGVDPFFTSWIIDYLMERPQFVRLGSCASDIVVSSTGAPQGTVLAPFLFTFYTSDFTYNTESCHVQKYSHDTAIVACVREEQEGEYRDLTRGTAFFLTPARPRSWSLTTVGLSHICSLLTSRARTLLWCRPTSSWGCIWTTSLTGRLTQVHYTKRYRAGC